MAFGRRAAVASSSLHLLIVGEGVVGQQGGAKIVVRVRPEFPCGACAKQARRRPGIERRARDINEQPDPPRSKEYTGPLQAGTTTTDLRPKSQAASRGDAERVLECLPPAMAAAAGQCPP
jgi:hypothetical protein